MENVKEMGLEKNPESHLTSAAAFVDGGILDPCDDACSICLEDFSDSDPSSITICKHEFHLQCILEWCQRSSQCPMCWQPISLKDPSSQELLDAVERERNFRAAPPPRNTTIFHHPTLGDFELQHLPAGVNDAELEERIIQHLAAAAAMGRAHHIRRRESHRGRPSAQGRSHYLVFSTHSSEQHPSGNTESNAVSAAVPSTPTQNPSDASGSNVIPSNHQGTSFIHRNSFTSQSSPDGAGPSDLQSFSDALKSKFTAMSSRYKESFSKSTRGWKERLFSRNSSSADSGSEARREMNQGIASVSRMVERLEAGDDNGRHSRASISDILGNGAGVQQGDGNGNENNTRTTSASC